MKYETCTDCKEQEKIGHKWAGTIFTLLFSLWKY